MKTRLGADIGMEAAAYVAAAALLDTIDACRDASRDSYLDSAGAVSCHLSLDGDLAGAVQGDLIRQRLTGWVVHPQQGPDFAARLADAHGRLSGAVVQVGMDTPQLTAELLRAAAAGLDDHDAVLGPSEDGGWWVLALRDARHGELLRDVPMSTPTTYADTRAALEEGGLDVGTTARLRDVDTMADADAVVRDAPGTRFAQAWVSVRGSGPRTAEP